MLEDAAPGAAAAAHAAGMRCIAIPYVAAQADAPEFATAGLLLRGGQGEFTARAAYTWLACARCGPPSRTPVTILAGNVDAPRPLLIFWTIFRTPFDISNRIEEHMAAPLSRRTLPAGHGDRRGHARAPVRGERGERSARRRPRAPAALAALAAPAAWSVRPFGLEEVTLGRGVFADKRRLMLDHARGYDVNRQLQVFRANAGLSTLGAVAPGGWEGLDGEANGNLRGHYTGHFLTMLSQAYRGTGERIFAERIGTMVGALTEVREALRHDPAVLSTQAASAPPPRTCAAPTSTSTCPPVSSATPRRSRWPPGSGPPTTAPGPASSTSATTPTATSTSPPATPTAYRASPSPTAVPRASRASTARPRCPWTSGVTWP